MSAGQQHTVGPWTIDVLPSRASSALGGTIRVLADSRGVVASIALSKITDNGVREADSRLIAAAPDLLAALRAIEAYEDDEPAPGTREAEIAAMRRAAIARATA